jgi:PAS domain S-box-containing protein
MFLAVSAAAVLLTSPGPPRLTAGAALVGLVAVLLTAAVTWLLVKVLLERPVRRLTDGVRRLGEGDLGFRFEVRRDDELSALAESFNAMAARVEASLRELRETRDYFEGIVENSADIIVTVSPSGYVYTFNRGAETVLGFRRDEVIGRNVEMLFPDAEEQERLGRRLRGAENLLNYETRLRTKDGQVRDVILTLSRLRDPEGNAIGTFGIGKDVTEANRMRQSLLHAERFAAIGQAVAGIQHAMKNMLNAMKGGSYMVNLGIGKEDATLVREGWDIVQDGIGNITKMSLAMLKYVREWRPEFEEVDLAALLGEIGGLFRPAAREKGVELVLDLDDGALRIVCDGKLVHSALMDMLSNSLDACLEKDYPEGESPRIIAGARSSPSGRELVLSVRDNGCGMSDEVRANVFTPFFSTKRSWGTGLGMALTARTIRLHGGEIEVESKPNEGSVFRIILPVGGPPPEPVEAA